jgi:hypothetical protein
VLLGVIDITNSEELEALVNGLEIQIQPVADPSFPAIIESVDVALRQ